MFSEIMCEAVQNLYGTEEKVEELNALTPGEIMERICENLMVTDDARECAQNCFPDDDPKIAGIKTLSMLMMSFLAVALEELQEKYGFDMEAECERLGLMKAMKE